MNKTKLKTYESPKAEVIEIESQGVLCASAGPSSSPSFTIENENFG